MDGFLAGRRDTGILPRTGAAPVAVARRDRVPGSVETVAGAESHAAGVRRWTINGDFLGLAPTGVARYGREVTLALDALIAEAHPLAMGLHLDLVAAREPDAALPLSSIPCRVVPEATRPRLPQVWVQAQLPRHLEGGLLSFCNLAPIGPRHHIACIHDAQTRLTPASYGRLFRLLHRLVLPLVGHRADRIVTVSASSREDLVRFGIAPRARIGVAHNGSDHALRWKPEAARLSWARDRPFVFCIGRPQAHKNPELLKRLATLLDADGIDVVMAGDLAASAGDPPNLHLVGRIGDDDIAAALRHALCFALPSRAEGFGLPAVEAMALGCPVVASTAPALPEVCAAAALYADPDDAAAWAGHVRVLASEPALRQRLVEAGRRRAAGFSWRSVAISYLALMAAVDESRTRIAAAARS